MLFESHEARQEVSFRIWARVNLKFTATSRDDMIKEVVNYLDGGRHSILFTNLKELEGFPPSWGKKEEKTGAIKGMLEKQKQKGLRGSHEKGIPCPSQNLRYTPYRM